ncbi:TPA: hypothetical protein VA047_001305 [Streptococcus agalactiae]|nr:hypothetical protein [Streptococcus agalactiae]
MSKLAIEKGRSIASQKEIIKIGTADIFKPRLLMKFVNYFKEHIFPYDFAFPHTSEAECDVVEAIYCDIAWKGHCQFYELFQTPLAVAVNSNHPLALKKMP